MFSQTELTTSRPLEQPPLLHRDRHQQRERASACCFLIICVSGSAAIPNPGRTQEVRP